MKFCTVQIKSLAVVTVALMTSSCAQLPFNYLDADYDIQSTKNCLFVNIPEKELAVVTLQEYKEIFPESTYGDKFSGPINAAFLGALSEKTNCGSQSLKLDQNATTTQFKQQYKEGTIRVSVVSNNPSASLAKNTIALIINNVSFDKLGWNSYSSGAMDAAVRNSAQTGYSLRFEYALQDLDTQEVFGYGIIETSDSSKKLFSRKNINLFQRLVDSAIDKLIDNVGAIKKEEPSSH